MTAPLPAAALRDLLRGWQQGVESDRDATAEYRAWVRRVVAHAFTSLEEGLTPYAASVLVVSSAFIGPDDVQVVLMPLTDEQIAAGQTVLEAWAEEDDPAEDDEE